DVSALSTVAVRLYRSVKEKPRYFNFPPFIVSELDETGELALELPECAWVVTIRSLTPTVAEQLFLDGLDKLNAIKDVPAPTEVHGPVKFMFKNALQLASLAAEDELGEAVQAILHGLTCIRDMVAIVSQASNSILVAAMERSKGPIKDILALLEDVSVYIFNRWAHFRPHHGQSNYKIASARIPLDTVESNYTPDVDAYLAQLGVLQKSFNASWLPTAVSYTDPIHALDNEPLDLSQQNIQATIDEPTETADIYEILDLLRPMDPGGYDSDRACLDGTRETVINGIITWTQDRDNSESFMWISGQPGMGKTAIAASLCQRLDTFQVLAGSFFCQRDYPDSRDPIRLINNIIYEIAIHCPFYAYEVAHAIRANRKLCKAHLSLRYEGLVKRPLEKLKSLTMPMTLVVIVDGLDECGDCDSRDKILQKLYEMSRLVPWLKIIFTGRPVGDLQESFQHNCPRGTVVHVQSYDASNDIRAYVESQLGDLVKRECWPHDSMERLCVMAQGVFLWAVLATKYIKKATLPPLSRLQKVLGSQKSPVADHYDALYTRVLKSILGDHDDETKDAYFRCIGIIMVTSEREPLTMSDLQCLLLAAGQIDQFTFERIVMNLGPLLSVTDGQCVRFYHSSFREYITNSSRSGEFSIQLDQYESECADLCLKVMQRDLKFNICELETSYLLNSEVPDLNPRIDSHIGTALKYACNYWVDHFVGSPNQRLVEATKKFFEEPQLMYWVEVLSLLGRMDVAISALYKLTSLELVRHPTFCYLIHALTPPLN
ncbi:hypothetical protein FRC11_004283, partial [Ceratobasidium sp. 423]